MNGSAALRMRMFMFAIAVMLVITGCGTQPVQKPVTYTVKAGDTVYSIAWKHGVDYHELARANRIGRDFHISIGQVLKLPRGTAMPSRPPASKPAGDSPRASANTVPAISSNIRWQWPVQSRTHESTTRPNGGKGLVIQGRAGQEVRAAAAGKVVYAGTGLLGYGQLLIIKHDEVFLSAYGHTQDLYVHEGDSVMSGQKIASMGYGPDGTPQMYFEIRSNGAPVSPLSLLPQQR